MIPMIEKPTISADFTVDDIHKIREYHYEITKSMSPEERRAYYRKRAGEAQHRIAEIRESKETKAI